MPKPRVLSYEEIAALKSALESGEEWSLDPRKGDIRARVLATLEARTKQTEHWRQMAQDLVTEMKERKQAKAEKRSSKQQ